MVSRPKKPKKPPRDKLTPEIVLKIRAEFIPNSHTHGLSALGRRYGVDQSTIRSVVKRETWRQVEEPK